MGDRPAPQTGVGKCHVRPIFDSTAKQYVVRQGRRVLHPDGQQADHHLAGGQNPLQLFERDKAAGCTFTGPAMITVRIGNFTTSTISRTTTTITNRKICLPADTRVTSAVTANG
ncbi:MAG: hypothetical protein WKF61_07635 [Luteimonas sp.]